MTDQQIAEYLERNTQARTPCEVWTRVMGYYRPTKYFNPGKRQEHADRKHFREEDATAA